MTKHCENSECNKGNLSKDDLVYDRARGLLICLECNAKFHPNPTPIHGEPQGPEEKREFSYDLRLTKEKGLQASVGFGGIKLGAQVSTDEMKKVFGDAFGD